MFKEGKKEWEEQVRGRKVREGGRYKRGVG